MFQVKEAGAQLEAIFAASRHAFYTIVYCVSMFRDMSLLAVTQLNILKCYSFFRNRLMKDNSQLNSVAILK